MKLIGTPLADLWILEFHRRSDERGTFSKPFDRAFLESQGIPFSGQQINISENRKAGTLRGMHFQKPPFAETKIVTCLHGELLDVAVDLRAGSPTFLQSFSIRLNAGTPRALVIPPGFAHGFQTLADSTTLLYAHDREYRPDSEAGCHHADPRLKLSWPLPISVISDRDRSFTFLNESFQGIAR